MFSAAVGVFTWACFLVKPSFSTEKKQTFFPRSNQGFSCSFFYDFHGTSFSKVTVNFLSCHTCSPTGKETEEVSVAELKKPWFGQRKKVAKNGGPGWSQSFMRQTQPWPFFRKLLLPSVKFTKKTDGIGILFLSQLSSKILSRSTLWNCQS